MRRPATPATPRLQTLAEIEAAAWCELGRAVHDEQHGWRLGVLATRDGDSADARMVVLRDLDQATRTLLIYTDSRSPKAQQVQQQPQGMLVLWSPALGWQLRLRLALSLQSSGLQVSSRWALLKLTPAAQDYLSPLPPGSPLDTPVPQRDSREHFAVLEGRVDSMDWLELHPLGQRRARFGAQDAAWIAP